MDHCWCFWSTAPIRNIRGANRGGSPARSVEVPRALASRSCDWLRVVLASQVNHCRHARLSRRPVKPPLGAQ